MGGIGSCWGNPRSIGESVGGRNVVDRDLMGHIAKRLKRGRPLPLDGCAEGRLLLDQPPFAQQCRVLIFSAN